MSYKCDLCLLGLIFLSSLLTGISEVDDHVFISSGENVSLSCNNALHDCTSTTWIYNNRYSAAVELITLGIKKKDTERHERLSLGSDCSLNIKNITEEDYGLYICRQYVNKQQHGADACVYLHVLQMSSSSSSSSQTEISADSVTLFCQLYLYSYTRDSCDWITSERIEVFWVNQAGVKLKRSDSRDQILFSSNQCIISLNTTLLNEDLNREWRCEVTHRDQVKTSVTYTVRRSARAETTTAETSRAPDSVTQIPVSSSNSEKKSGETPAPTSTQDSSNSEKKSGETPAVITSTETASVSDTAARSLHQGVFLQDPHQPPEIFFMINEDSFALNCVIHHFNCRLIYLYFDNQSNADYCIVCLSGIVIGIIISASLALLLPALILWLICKKRAGVRKMTEDSVEQTDDVTYTEVTVYNKHRAKKKKVRCDDKVTYASIGEVQENCNEL
ncbi:LOW QUALITY PROTEIN: uncharacterized protein LOC122333124 [Puntigrus tetrazona]|uniref:LOW QUALITY PROTEIN: uncharacterized protein LOC122333124 n=1 Tax=Puntigrus tetrazona TaxID=1606681 RepID=UPI001C8A83FD|nr:LOW QUALITY PROTEIN: uncharacterized protein LOC122333124 [Puntigrus tetrazona]